MEESQVSSEAKYRRMVTVPVGAEASVISKTIVEAGPFPRGSERPNVA